MKNSFEIDPYTSRAKRLFDIVFATILLLSGALVFPFISIAIKLNSTGPVFYQQLRVGRTCPNYTRLFKMIKFRTMNNDAEAKTGAVLAKDNDPRITSVGRCLRKTRLDELPQLINVLKGEMSLIGPRPERPVFYKRYEMAIPFFTDRTYGVSPGITGLAQIKQGYDTSIEDVRSKVGYDHSYALALSKPSSWLKMDLCIILGTIAVMFKGKGQ